MNTEICPTCKKKLRWHNVVICAVSLFKHVMNLPLSVEHADGGMQRGAFSLGLNWSCVALASNALFKSATPSSWVFVSQWVSVSEWDRCHGWLMNDCVFATVPIPHFHHRDIHSPLQVSPEKGLRGLPGTQIRRVVPATLLSHPLPRPTTTAVSDLHTQRCCVWSSESPLGLHSALWGLWVPLRVGCYQLMYLGWQSWTEMSNFNTSLRIK